MLSALTIESAASLDTKNDLIRIVVATEDWARRCYPLLTRLNVRPITSGWAAARSTGETARVWLRGRAGTHIPVELPDDRVNPLTRPPKSWGIEQPPLSPVERRRRTSMIQQPSAGDARPGRRTLALTGEICDECYVDCLVPLAGDLKRFWQTLQTLILDRDTQAAVTGRNVISVAAFKSLVAATSLLFPMPSSRTSLTPSSG